MPQTPRARLHDLLDVIDRLRAADGCPWDRDQTIESFRPYLLEEVYELIDATEARPSGATEAGPDPVREELGDVLFNALMMVRIGADAGRFDLDAVAGDIADKLIHRHPHVFAPDDPSRSAAWADNRPPGRGLLDGVPRSAPALVVAAAQGAKAATVGFDWPDAAGVLDKVDEELQELREAIASGDRTHQTHEVGDLLMAVASLARHLGVEPEAALRAGNARFAQRFARVEAETKAKGQRMLDLGPAALDAAWRRAKESLSAAPDEEAP